MMTKLTQHHQVNLILLRKPFWLSAAIVLTFMQMPTSVDAGDVSFNEQIRPILAEHCLQCHGPDAKQREADLRLDTEKAAKEHAIVPGKPDESELISRITSPDPDLRMPPAATGKRLTAAQIALVRQWIQQGAEYEGHWAYQPIRQPDIPAATDESHTEIDRFIVHKMNAKGLQLSPQINRQRLIRRATFDLIGLPPTWDEVTAFVNDTSSRAYEKVIDRLLASPRYGERWGRHWLDIARYADTHGGSAIGFKKFPFSYTYRDYVIRAFNADVPYNRFVLEQLAADQLGLKANAPALAGLGFLTVGMQFRNPHDTLDDQIDVITRGLLGMTVACARCHDHKFDAIPTTDYYALYATLASSSKPAMLPVIGQPKEAKPLLDYRKQLAKRQISRDDMVRDQSDVLRNRLRMQVGMYLRELAKGTPEQDVSTSFLSYRTDDLRPIVLERWRKYLAKLKENDPVFGPWLQLSQLEADDFAKRSAELLQSLVKENGDPKKLPPPQKLATAPPRWNPRVLAALQEKTPSSLLDVADAYGDLFGKVQREWLRALLEAALEAAPGAKVVPDEDPRHAGVNSAINRQLRRHLSASGTPTALTDEEASKLLNRPIRDNIRGREGAIHNLHLSAPGSPPRAMILREEKQPAKFHVFRRGNPVDRGETVQPRFLTAISHKEEVAPFPAGKRRLGLAQAIVDPVNPLTRRVIVNWVWSHHFGFGLVRTPDDFGTRGDPPTHPRLLDYLATKMLDDGWSLKKLHRRIMLSAVYQQAAREDSKSRNIDPENRLLWRMPRRRLDLEAMRDAMLAVSGELNPQMGGRPFNLMATTVVPRRSVYAFINRDIISNLASTFDAANPSSCTAKRPQTSVPQQTLFALNSAFIQDRAVKLAGLNSIVTAKSDGERVQRLYRRALSREAEPEEVELALRYVNSQGAKDKATAWQRLAHVLMASNEFVYVD